MDLRVIRKLLHRLFRFPARFGVGIVVIHNENLNGGIGLLQNGANAPGQIGGASVGGNNNGNQG